MVNGIVSFRDVFPDLHQTVDAVAIADNGHVFVKTQASAALTGDCGNIKANGKRWSVSVFWNLNWRMEKLSPLQS